MYFEFSDNIVRELGYPGKLCSVKLPNHNAWHFQTKAFANKVFRINGNTVHIIKDRDSGNAGKVGTISTEDLIILKLTAIPID